MFYLQNKLNDIAKAAEFRLSKKLSPDKNTEDYEFIAREVEAIRDLAAVSGSITLDQAYEQLRFIHEALESYKSKAGEKTQDVIDSFQKEITERRFGDLYERKIPKKE